MAIISKAAVVSVYALAVTAIVVAATVLTALFGIIFADGELPAQEFSTFSLLGRSVFYVLGFTLAGLLFAVWFRSVVLPVALLILLPNTVEPLASGLLSLGDKASYLPFTALQQVMLPSSAVGVWTLILVFSLYLVFGWVSGWILFSRRDAKT